MALTEQMWGFGGCRILRNSWSTLDRDIFYISGGFGEIKYSPVWIKLENINYEDISVFKGYRVTAELRLLNIREDDYIQFARLISMLADGKDVFVQPRFGVDDGAFSANNLGFTMRLDSDVSFEDLNRVEIGQELKLKFVQRGLVKSIPTSVKYFINENWVDQADNQMVDQDGNTFIMKIY